MIFDVIQTLKIGPNHEKIYIRVNKDDLDIKLTVYVYDSKGKKQYKGKNMKKACEVYNGLVKPQIKDFLDRGDTMEMPGTKYVSQSRYGNSF